MDRYFQTLQEDIVQKSVKQIVEQLDQKMIEGLKRKGYYFISKSYLIEFIKTRCRCEDYTHKQERIYFVDNKPFFSHKYGGETVFEQTTLVENTKSINATWGSFSFL